jgi:site-specific recombinase XerD
MRNTALFLNRFGEPLGDRGVQKIIEKHLKKADLENASVHTLRHTFGVYHSGKGVNLNTLKEVMGHSDIRSTQLYLFLADEIAQKELQENPL